MNKHHLRISIIPLTLLCLTPICFLPAPAYGQSVPARIALLVVDGEGAYSGARQRATRDPAVRVEDDDHRPVAGAAVVFALPVSGASGEFVNGSKTLSLLTGQDGIATARGLKTNDVPGKLQIYVTASYRGQRARALITQTIEPTSGAAPNPRELRASKSGGKWKWALLGLAAAGGAGAGYYYTRRTENGSPSLSIAAGTVVFGSPR